MVSKVKGHADEGMVAVGRVREVDRIGNIDSGAAADMGRRRVHWSIHDARRLVNGACARWYPIVKEFQHFFVAIARTVVNHDGSGRYFFASGCLMRKEAGRKEKRLLTT